MDRSPTHEAPRLRRADFNSYIPFIWGVFGAVMLGVSLVLFTVAWMCRRMQRTQARTKIDIAELRRAA